MIVHIVPKQEKDTLKQSQAGHEKLIFNFYKDEAPFIHVTDVEVKRRHFLHAMVARERYSA